MKPDEVKTTLNLYKGFYKARLVDSQPEKLIQYLKILKESGNYLQNPKIIHYQLEYLGCREFHLGGDMLIIYLENSKAGEIILLRISTHSQLFK